MMDKHAYLQSVTAPRSALAARELIMLDPEDNMTQPPKVVPLQFTFALQHNNYRTIVIPDIPVTLLWRAYTIRQAFGYEAVLEFLQFAEIVGQVLRDVKSKYPGLDIKQLFAEFWADLPSLIQMPPGTNTEVQQVLALTYNLLRGHMLNHAEAAQLASSILGREIKPDTWRKRVDRWAKTHGLPKVELKRTKP
jgi:hypothetical protein